MKKFLIINPFGIGDVLFTTAVISNIKVHYPESIVGYWCNERVKGILENNPCIDKVFALSRGDIKKIYQKSKLEGMRRALGLYLGLKRERFDISLDYSLDHRYSLVSKLIGIKRRIGFDYKNRGRFLTDKLNLDGYADKHVVEYYLDLLKFINIEPCRFNLELNVTEANKIRSRKILTNYGINNNDSLIGIAAGAGASWGSDAALKHWPAANFARLADKIINNYHARILILGDELERPIVDTIIKRMDNPVIDLAGKTTLEDLVALIDNLNILISNDGGPLHIAAALGKKTVSFFGPVDPKVYGPYPPDEKCHIVLSKTLDCSPCYRNFRLSSCQRSKECLETIDVEEAWEAVKRLLS